MSDKPHFEFDREDKYMYFASNILPDDPIIVEVGSINGAHGIKLCKKFDNRLTMIECEAGRRNYETLKAQVSLAGESRERISVVNSAITGLDGSTDFFEFEEISSNSTYPRHETEGRHLRERRKVETLSLTTLMQRNNCDRIDLLFLNCEGSELGILEEVLTKPELRNKIGQLCVSFHGGRIYPPEETIIMVQKMSDFFWVIEEKNDWPCHLFVNKSLKTGGK
jgi:FkbM family methyltransferase